MENYNLHLKADVNTIAEALMDTYGIDLFDKRRARSSVDARIVAGYILCKLGYGVKQIGKEFGRDHSTIIYYRDEFVRRASSSGELINYYQTAQERVGGARGSANRKKVAGLVGRIEYLEQQIRDMRVENAMLRKREKNLTLVDSKYEKIINILKQRMVDGTEDEVAKRLYWMLNSVAEQHT